MKPRHKRLALVAAAASSPSAPRSRSCSTRSRATSSSSTRRRRSPRTKRRACAPSASAAWSSAAPSSATARTCSFIVTDTAKSIPVAYDGILPDLFKEGKGVVAQGQLQGDVFVAREVLAKHDENYMPPEAADALKRAQQGNPKLAESLAAEPIRK